MDYKKQGLEGAPNQKTMAFIFALLISVATHSPSAGQTPAPTPNHRDSTVIGWDGDQNGVISHLDGGYHLRLYSEIVPDHNPCLSTPTPSPFNDVSFGIYNNPATLQWYNTEGYLPCLVTEFERENCTVKISNFGDKVFINSNPFVLIYSRISVHNHDPNNQPHTLDPAPSASPGSTPVALTNNSFTVPPGNTVNHDYIIAADRFGGAYAWPTATQLLAVPGDWDAHYAAMKTYWNGKLNAITQIQQLAGNTDLINAYKTGYIYTHIVKDGNDLKTGEVNYDTQRFDGDKLGILATLLTIGEPDGLTYLNEFPIDPQFGLARWQYPWLWAIYLEKTGRTADVDQKFQTIRMLARQIHDDRCLVPGPYCFSPPNRLMQKTELYGFDYWGLDNWSALIGLTSYKYICDRLGYPDESAWADGEYNDLLATLNQVHGETIDCFHLNYLPISIYRPNQLSLPFYSYPHDANWGVMLSFGRWAWDGYLFGAYQTGVEVDLIDGTYTYGFQATGLEPHNFGAYSAAGYSSAYNAGYGTAALRGEIYRSEGIYAYLFSLEKGQCGPFSWWESFTRPADSPWVGTHPGGRAFCTISGPHMWGQSTATKILIDSLIALKSDRSVIIGRGVPSPWVANSNVIKVSNFPVADGGRNGFTLSGSSGSDTIRLTLDNSLDHEAVLDLRALKNNITAVTAGTPSSADGTVTLPPGITDTVVTLATPIPAPTPTATASVTATPGPTPVFVTVSLPILETALDTFNAPVAVPTPITVADNLVGFEGDLTFDSSVIGPPAVSKAGLTNGNWTVSGNVLPGTCRIKTLRISAYSNDTTPLSGSGTLFQLNMQRHINEAGANTPLVWDLFQNRFAFINPKTEPRVPNSAPPGSVTLLPAPTATATALPSTTPAQPLNLSTRMLVQTGAEVGIGGFIVTGNAPKRVILRSIGPSLTVTGKLADTVMELHGPAGFTTIINDNWRDTQEAEIIATGIPPTDDLESAIVATLAPGAYTAIVSGKNGTSGVGLVEVYDLSPVASKLGNISTRAFVGTGSNIVIAGFILGNGSGMDNVIVRGIGPSLPVSGKLADPTLELRDSNGALIRSDNNWMDDPAQKALIMAAGLGPPNPLESAIYATLAPGPYTVLLSGVNNGTGVGLVEAYDLAQ